MDGFSRLAYVETKLFLRETGAAIGVFGLPWSRRRCRRGSSAGNKRRKGE
jgi:hypothetical protein